MRPGRARPGLTWSTPALGRRKVALATVGPSLGRWRRSRAMRAGPRRRFRPTEHGGREWVRTDGHRRRLVTWGGGGGGGGPGTVLSGTVLSGTVGARAIGARAVLSGAIGARAIGARAVLSGTVGAGAVLSGTVGARAVGAGARARAGSARRRRGPPVAVVDDGAGGIGVVTGMAEPRGRRRAHGVDLTAQSADLGAQGVTLTE